MTARWLTTCVRQLLMVGCSPLALPAMRLSFLHLEPSICFLWLYFFLNLFPSSPILSVNKFFAYFFSEPEFISTLHRINKDIRFNNWKSCFWKIVFMLTLLFPLCLDNRNSYLLYSLNSKTRHFCLKLIFKLTSVWLLFFLPHAGTGSTRSHTSHYVEITSLLVRTLPVAMSKASVL